MEGVRCVGGEGWMWVVGACLCFYSVQVFAHVHCVCVCVCVCVFCVCVFVSVCVCVCTLLIKWLHICNVLHVPCCRACTLWGGASL